MAVLFSAREVIEAAVEKERKRKGFYACVTELSTNQDMKDLFQFLTEEEERHVAAFEQIRDNLPEDTHPAEYTEEMQAYMTPSLTIAFIQILIQRSLSKKP